MNEYVVNLSRTSTTSVTIRAESAEAAEELALSIIQSHYMDDDAAYGDNSSHDVLAECEANESSGDWELDGTEEYDIEA